MQYEYMVKTKGMSMLSSIEDLGKSVEHGLNQDGNGVGVGAVPGPGTE
jgi:hypothetical protein